MARALLSVLFFLGCLVQAYADQDTYAVGVSGYDPVAFFEDMSAKKGHPDHTYELEGITYQFASDEHKELFKENPGQYLPQYGGWCAYGIAFEARVRSDPEYWMILDGKLYINDEHSHGLWLEETTKLVSQADAFWAAQAEE